GFFSEIIANANSSRSGSGLRGGFLNGGFATCPGRGEVGLRLLETRYTLKGRVDPCERKGLGGGD
ncbi:Hypothetical predicted protein, partial [Marmota monax]